MTKYHKRHRIIATFFLLIFFPTLLPNNLFASNNGPKSPEAASFEPVDATDMVNLITGQYSYVLPLLNVPSPEGGYPIAMAYHAGIALDQEASWTGLGWNVNPGAIDRNINGYPDDYNSSQINEYFYDKGNKVTQNYVSVGYSYGASVGVGFNWGSNQSLGGFVSAGYGYDLGYASLGANANIGFGSSSNSNSIGLTLSTGALQLGADFQNGKVDSSVILGTSGNIGGFSIGYHSSGDFSLNTSLGGQSFIGFSLSSTGTLALRSVLGNGISNSFNSTVQRDDYAKKWTSSMYGLVVPTQIGTFSLTTGNQSFKYALSKNKNSYITGPLNYYKGTENLTKLAWDGFNGWMTVVNGKVFMDIYEITASDNTLTETTNIATNNMTFPSYDSYNVQAQGISGTMTSTLLENGALFGLDGKENDEGYKLNYPIGAALQNYYDTTKFNKLPAFYFENEISTYSNVADVGVAQFNSTPSNINAYSYYSSGVDAPYAKSPRKTSNFIEYFTNEELSPLANTSNGIPPFDVVTGTFDWGLTIDLPSSSVFDRGYLKPNASGFDRNNMPKDGIGAFKITAPDGKTYHYSLPVYNHEIITRSYGAINTSSLENQSYFEKRQMEPYATHWLLTAVTGPDFIDNGDGMAGNGDLGYWASFEYGKWSDAFIWKAPYKKEHFVDSKNPQVKTWIRGRKQLYYLDKIKTRTHTALFIKSERTDAASENWTYSSVKHLSGQPGQFQNESHYVSRFSVPSQKQLRLDKIILLKNDDDLVVKSKGSHSSVTINYNNGYGTGTVSPYGEDDSSWGKYEVVNYNSKNYVLDDQDNWQTVIPKAIKIIDFNYDYSLVPGDNRLTLKSLNFNGKSNASILPPYKFDYITDNTSFNIDNKDGWGYKLNSPQAFSLNKITTPQGGIININYESNNYISAVPHELTFSSINTTNFTADPIINQSGSKLTGTINIGNSNQNSYPINIGQEVKIFYSNTTISSAYGDYYLTYDGTGYISNILGNGKYEITFNGNPVASGTPGIGYSYVSLDVKINFNNIAFLGGGIRVKSLKISDGLNNYITDYKYGENENGIGYVSYVPFAQNIIKEVPYSVELPAPRVMYEYITMSSHKENFQSLSKTQYKFNIIKSKDLNKIKYGNFYEIVTNKAPIFTNSSGTEVNINAFTIKDNLASIGQLIEIKTFNSQMQQISKLSNNYYDITSIPNNMGVTQESYQTYKGVDYINNSNGIKDKLVINSSTRIKYSSIAKSSTDQKHGYSYTTEFNDYDLISGFSKEKIMTTSDGKLFKKKIIPAYTKYPQMGSKANFHPNNFFLPGSVYYKNMLSQIAAEYTYSYDPSDSSQPWKETGVGITTWSNIWAYKGISGQIFEPTNDKEKIWRKHKSYTWNGTKNANGIFTNYNSVTGSGDDGFLWDLPSGVGVDVAQPSQWKQISEVTLYNHYSAPLEVKDINSNYASTKMGDNDSKTSVSGNARYGEMYYSGAEYLPLQNFPTYLEPEISVSNASQQSSAYFHTGKKSIETTSTSTLKVSMKNLEHRAGKYKVSVWVEKTNASKAAIKVDNTAYSFISDNIIAGNWQLKTAYLPLTTAACTIYLSSADTSKVYFDDLMVRPVSSSIAGYVYNEWGELTYIIGNNGLATKFEYDAAGRLIKTSTEVIDDSVNGVTGGFKVVKANTYNNKYLN